MAAQDPDLNDELGFDFEEEGSESKGPNVVLILFALIIVGGAGFFVFKDEVKPLEDSGKGLHSRWHEDRLKADKPTGDVPALTEDWRVSMPLDVASKKRRVSAKSKRAARKLTAKGNTLSDGGDHKGAIGQFEKALTHSPKAKKTLAAYAKALLEVGRFRDALDAAHKASVLDPKKAETFALLGKAHQKLGFRMEAIAAYENYLKLAPSGALAADIQKTIKTLRGPPKKP